jgi:hypothetical protein
MFLSSVERMIAVVFLAEPDLSTYTMFLSSVEGMIAVVFLVETY